MADRLYTSSEADEILSALRFETKLEKATLVGIPAKKASGTAAKAAAVVL